MHDVKRPVICVSGGADPVHKGHIDMIEHASAFGSVVWILNSDEWLARKKDFQFMDFEHRKRILLSLRDIAGVSAVDDSDGTVCEALRRIKPDYFANGGDRTESNTPELQLCKELGIKPLFNIGGGKKASSSELVSAIKKA